MPFSRSLISGQLLLSLKNWSGKVVFVVWSVVLLADERVADIASIEKGGRQINLFFSFCQQQ
jgi:hypothetical protein